MSKVMTGRMTHRYDGELVVFHIGMQINKPWRPDLWLPVFGAMPRMLAELSRDPGSGLLGYRLVLGAGGPSVVQYWSSKDKLYAYASNPEQEHRPAWTAFNRRARRAPGAGVRTLAATVVPSAQVVAARDLPGQRRRGDPLDL